MYKENKEFKTKVMELREELREIVNSTEKARQGTILSIEMASLLKMDNNSKVVKKD